MIVRASQIHEKPLRAGKRAIEIPRMAAGSVTGGMRDARGRPIRDQSNKSPHRVYVRDRYDVQISARYADLKCDELPSQGLTRRDRELVYTSQRLAEELARQ